MFLIDTNVMLAASAIHEFSLVAERAMPEEIELREMVFEWLAEFDESDQKMLMDEEGLVREEYERNLPYNHREQEYGMQVLQNKLDHGLVEYVSIDTLDANGEHIAVLDLKHEPLVPDREDRKWVACALASIDLLACSPPIVYGAETDWFMAAKALNAIGVQFVSLLPDSWYQQRIN